MCEKLPAYWRGLLVKLSVLANALLQEHAQRWEQYGNYDTQKIHRRLLGLDPLWWFFLAFDEEIVAFSGTVPGSQLAA
jgi:hypothetical protein